MLNGIAIWTERNIYDIFARPGKKRGEENILESRIYWNKKDKKVELDYSYSQSGVTYHQRKLCFDYILLAEVSHTYKTNTSQKRETLEILFDTHKQILDKLSKILLNFKVLEVN